MSDPVTNMNVEDVLSSIRRLVAEDPEARKILRNEPQADRRAPNGKLVLTPSQRINDTDDGDLLEKDAPETDADGAPTHAQGAAPVAQSVVAPSGSEPVSASQLTAEGAPETHDEPVDDTAHAATPETPPSVNTQNEERRADKLTQIEALARQLLAPSDAAIQQTILSEIKDVMAGRTPAAPRVDTDETSTTDIDVSAEAAISGATSARTDHTPPNDTVSDTPPMVDGSQDDTADLALQIDEASAPDLFSSQDDLSVAADSDADVNVDDGATNAAPASETTSQPDSDVIGADTSGEPEYLSSDMLDPHFDEMLDENEPLRLVRNDTVSASDAHPSTPVDSPPASASPSKAAQSLEQKIAELEALLGRTSNWEPETNSDGDNAPNASTGEIPWQDDGFDEAVDIEGADVAAQEETLVIEGVDDAAPDGMEPTAKGGAISDAEAGQALTASDELPSADTPQDELDAFNAWTEQAGVGDLGNLPDMPAETEGAATAAVVDDAVETAEQVIEPDLTASQSPMSAGIDGAEQAPVSTDTPDTDPVADTAHSAEAAASDGPADTPDHTPQDASEAQKTPAAPTVVDDAEKPGEQPTLPHLRTDRRARTGRPDLLVVHTNDRYGPGGMSEEELHEMVAQAIRKELQGVLGERITRNVRKLVRREIQRALTQHDLD